MKGFKLVIYYTLQWTWGIIQNIVGLIMRLYSVCAVLIRRKYAN